MASHKIRITGLLALTWLIAPGLLLAASPARAATPVEHCVMQVSESSSALAPQPLCFGTTAEVEAYVRAGNAQSEMLPRTSARQAGNTVIGTVYKDINGQGSSLTFWGANGCVGRTFGFSSLSAEWSKSISSVRGANGCWVTAYTTTGYGGSKLNCTPYCSSLGAWNDNVKSLVFRPKNTFG